MPNIARIAIAVGFVAGQAALVAADLSSDDDALAITSALGLPLIAGFLIGRWWALALALTPLLLYAIDSDITGDLGVGFALGASVLLNLICLTVGVCLGRLFGPGHSADQ